MTKKQVQVLVLALLLFVDIMKHTNISSSLHLNQVHYLLDRPSEHNQPKNPGSDPTALHSISQHKRQTLNLGLSEKEQHNIKKLAGNAAKAHEHPVTVISPEEPASTILDIFVAGFPKQESAVHLEPMAADVESEEKEENQTGAVDLGEDEEETGGADPIGDHVENASKGGNLTEFTGEPTVQGVTNEANKIKEGEEDLVLEANSEADAVHQDSNVSDDVRDVEIHL